MIYIESLPCGKGGWVSSSAPGFVTCDFLGTEPLTEVCRWVGKGCSGPDDVRDPVPFYPVLLHPPIWQHRIQPSCLPFQPTERRKREERGCCSLEGHILEPVHGVSVSMFGARSKACGYSQLSREAKK